MPSLRESLPAILDALRASYGAAGRAAPDDEPFARLVRSLLERSYAPERAAATLAGLRDGGLLGPSELASAAPAEIVAVLEAAGIMGAARIAGALRRLAGWAVDRLPEVDSTGTDALREGLRSLRGIGPTTADAILLHALGRPSYPVDRGTYRVLVRHGWIDPTVEYDEAREVIESATGASIETLGQLAWGLERVAGEFCRVSAARCDRCPLRPFLPEGGPLPVGLDG
jgi:endonuclease-3 related protein